ncbi:hypothetical protein GOV12_03545 [Candidatus Pacearchaeota archaeon]|nr:hypothetical protein [Candidatus Pacearchaeota archaeon]
MYLKRKTIPKFWPIPRKGTKYLAVCSHNKNNAIPLNVVMRDVLKLVNNNKELKHALKQKQILINNKIISETNYPVSLFDIITITTLKKNYKTFLSEYKKFKFEEVSGKESESKVFKVLGKKVLGKNKTQINLSDGRNLLFTDKEKVKTGDSVLFDLKNNKMIKIIPMEKGKNVFVIEGKHAGKYGKISEIIERGGKTIAKIIADKDKMNVWIKNIIVIE